MTNNDYIKCIVSILNFIILSEDEVVEHKTFSTVSHTEMTKVLKKYSHTMVSFTVHLSPDLWVESPKEFFSNHYHCISFFTSKLQEFNQLNLSK